MVQDGPSRPVGATGAMAREAVAAALLRLHGKL